MDGMYAAGETRLNISDIQHYSTGDGDGIWASLSGSRNRLSGD